jgi:ATP-dependent DNA helicase RecG
MNDAFSRLLKVLSLERRQGYRNKAVIGGLDKFASRWEVDARSEASNHAAISEIVALLLGYPSVNDTTARERIIEQIVRRVQEASPATLVDEDLSEESHSVPDADLSDALPPDIALKTAHEKPPDNSSAGVSSPIRGEATREAGGDLTRPAIPVHALPKPEPEAASASLEPGGKERERSAEPRSAAGLEQPMPAPTKPLVTAPAEPTPARPGPSVTRPDSSGPEALAQAKLEEGTTSRVGPRGTKPTSGVPSGGASGPHREPPSGFDAPVTRLPSVGPSLAQRLEKLKVRTIRDLLYLLPTRYEDYSRLRTIDKLKYGEYVTIIGTVWNLQSRMVGDSRKIINAVIGDGTGELQITWFNPYVERRLRTGRAYSFSGKIESYRSTLLLRNPEFEPLEKHQVSTGRLVPVYPLTEGISARWLRRIMDHAVNAWAMEVADFLPDPVRIDAHLLTLGEALRQIHFPDSAERLEAAHRRLSFDEFFLLQLGVMAQRRRFHEFPARPLRVDRELLDPFLGLLPFTLTSAQLRAIEEITQELCRSQPMSRLLQGDVGSGKTAVAAAALWLAVANGCQGAIMAPTEILAEQHARSFGAFFNSLPVPGTGRTVRVALLTGSMRLADRETALSGLASGEIDIAIGTHALIQTAVTFRDLAVAVVDEQHRFGVEQRGALRQKGLQPHVLVMSATPIPRSLALTIYGDLDISVLDEMPPGRLAVKTKWLTSSWRERAYTFIRRQVQEGRQAFIIYPWVQEEETEVTDDSAPATNEIRSAVEAHRWLQADIFPDLKLGLLHGRMRGEEKDAIMQSFGMGEFDILVATSVVEVGIDIPNASVIMVEGAERFGLAQLHQLRGRVGRGGHASFCILVSDAVEGDSVKRLQAMENSNDGFALAQIDLDMRGPGDFFGTRQSGLPPLRTAQLGDLRTLEAARSSAQKVFADDPSLGRPEHRGLADEVAMFWSSAGDRS